MRARMHRASKSLARYNDVILILGDGDSMPFDLKTFLSWDIKHDSAALGRAVRQYPSIANGIVNHWFNADGETAIDWARRLPKQTVKHTLGNVDGFDVDWDIEQPDYHHQDITGDANRSHGSSAFFATLACINMGYEKIVLAGCPLDTEGHYYFQDKNKETLGPIWLGFDFMTWIDFSKTDQAENVRSLSGYTAKILGEATPDWINNELQNLQISQRTAMPQMAAND